MPRRSADLTDSNKQKLKSQGISSDDLHEASIIRVRYECDKRRTLYRVLKSEPDHQLRQQEVCESITELFMKTNNAGGKQFIPLIVRPCMLKESGDWMRVCILTGNVHAILCLHVDTVYSRKIW